MFSKVVQHIPDMRERIHGLTEESDDAERNVGISKTESALAFAAAISTGLLARELLKTGWRTALDREPPKNPSSEEVAWKDALLWGVASGAIVGLARIASRRATSGVYRRYLQND